MNDFDDTNFDTITRDLHRLIVNDQSRLLNDVLDYYPLLVDRCDPNERCLLHDAAESGSWGCVEVLLRHGLDINTTDVMGETPLHRALVRHRFDTTKALLAAGANPNVRNIHGATPTLYAAQWSSEVLGHVIDAGGDADAVDKQGDGIEHWAMRGARQAAQSAAISKMIKI